MYITFQTIYLHETNIIFQITDKNTDLPTLPHTRPLCPPVLPHMYSFAFMVTLFENFKR